MTRLLLLLPLLFSGFLVSAQHPSVPPLRCGNDLFREMLRNQHPELDAAFNATFEHARRFRADDRSPLTINVVVHVVWKNPEENLADSIIENQIQVLNEDYNRLNADTADLRDLFKPVAASADIHFNLVQIVRVPTTQLFEVDPLGGSLLTELKSTAQGGSDAWDPEHYLNIWVCNIQPIVIFGTPIGQILGFAFPPNDLDNWPAQSGAPTLAEDGVVIDFRVFGRNNPNTIDIPGSNGQQLIVKGRTPVHEVGHYLGLRHIWGDGGFLGLPNNCDESDGIDDTPFANAQSEFDCDKLKNSCTQSEVFYNADVPDLVENYMDYSSEDCMNMFTQGQVALMRNVLQGPRAGLLTPVSTQQPDDAFAWQLWPNPASGQCFLQADLPEAGPVQVRLLSADGRTISVYQSGTAPAGRLSLPLSLESLAPGMYTVQLWTGQRWACKKMVLCE